MEIAPKVLMPISKLVTGAVLALSSQAVLACATCGLSASYTPRMFAISTGFVLLPTGFAGFIGWRLWLDHKHQVKTNAERDNDTTKT